MNPINFKPLRAQDFIGPARDLALILDSIIKRAAPAGEPVKILIRGLPGIGKSALLDYFVQQLGANKWSTTKLNGTQLKMEHMDDWTRTLALRDMFGGYRVLRIEEIDKTNCTLQARMLTVLDDLCPHSALICTSNKELKDFDPRFQSRFQVFSLDPPDTTQVKKLLSRFPLRKDVVNRIATFAAGNVRLALFDAQSALDEDLALKGTWNNKKN